MTSSLVCDRTILSGLFNYSMMWQPLNTCTYLCVWPAISVTLHRPFAQLRFKFRLSLNTSFHTAGTLRGTPRKWHKRNKFALLIVTCWTHCFTKMIHLEASFTNWMLHPRSLTNVCFFTFGLPQLIFGRNTAPCFTHLKQNSDNKLPVIHWLHIWPLQCVVRYRFVSDWGLKDFSSYSSFIPLTRTAGAPLWGRITTFVCESKNKFRVNQFLNYANSKDIIDQTWSL